MRKDNVESAYRLSPTQEGMLFHTLYEPESGLYFLQFTCTLRGELDLAAFKAAWEGVFVRHSALRTGFYWEGLEKPVQAVWRTVELPWSEMDWRDLSAAEQRHRWDELVRADRREGIDIRQPPLVRLTLARIEDDAWRFCWSIPHLLMDGWCLPILLNEVFALYVGRCRGEDVSLEPARPYRDYITWLMQQDHEEAKRFWRLLLAGFTSPTPLAVSRPAPAADDGRYIERGLDLSRAATERLAGIARRYKLTVNTLAQAAWGLLLFRYSGERDVVFGSTVSGRSAPVPGIETMVGLFINTLPVRALLDPQAAVIPWLRSLQEQQAEMRQFEHSPLADVQGWSELPRGVPLFESILVFENFPVDPGLQSGVRAAVPLAIEDVVTLAKTNYALTVLVQLGERLALRVKYEPGLFETTTADRMLSHFERLLSGLAATPSQSLGEVEWLSAAERHQLLAEWNDTEAQASSGLTLHELFERQARRTPDAVAVVAGGVELGYGEVERQANQLASHLRSLGIGPGDSVAIHVGRRWEMIPALLGILKAGAAYVPVDIAFPRPRVLWILGSLHVCCVVTQPSQAELLASLAPELPQLRHAVWMGGVSGQDDAWARERGASVSWADLSALPAEGAPSDAGPDDFAYTIFTSGSTGMPKGVRVRHRPAVQLVEWVNSTYGVGPHDRVLFVTALGFDLSVYDIFGLLAAGGSIRLADTADMQEPMRLVRALVDEPITFWDSAPAQLQQLVPLLEQEGEPARETALRLVFLSGDWVPLALPGQVRSTFKDARVVALGGATEATVWSNHFPVEAVAPEWASIPYGRPMWNARYHVLDGQLEPCCIGVPGDLYIAGSCLASGYAADPAQTAASFLPDAFGGVGGAGGRMYRTGDRARHGFDGNLEFLGRLDQQVKIRGFRIELGEIEAALEQHPAVRAAVAVAREDEPGRKRLVAYITTPSNPDAPPPAAEELRRFLSDRLPEYMVPPVIVLLESFPVTANGKLDRRALPAPNAGIRPAGRVEPRDETERLLTRIWCEVLRTENVGVEDNFFELGGDSILSIQIVSRALRHGLSIQPRQLFELPTIAELARVAVPVGAEPTPSHAGDTPSTPTEIRLFRAEPGGELEIELTGVDPASRSKALQAIAPAETGAVWDPGPGCGEAELIRTVSRFAGLAPVLLDLPEHRRLESVAELSPAQEGMLFHSLLAPDSGVYCTQMGCTLEGDLDVAAFRETWKRVLARHSILRSFFHWEGLEKPVQVVVRDLDLPFQELDWSRMGESEQRARLAELELGERARGFELDRPPLLRLNLIRLGGLGRTGNGVHRFLWTCHHLLVDGWSLSLLFQEVFVLYKGLREGIEPALEAGRPYHAYISWLQRQDLAGAESYWRRALHGYSEAAPLEIAGGDPSGGAAMGWCEHSLDELLGRSLRAFARRHRLTLNTLIQGAWGLLLSRYTGRDDVVFGSAVSGRPAELPGAESIVGPFINTLPVRVQVPAAAEILHWLLALQERQVEQRQHEHSPLVRIQGWSELPASQPLFDTLLVFDNYPTPEVAQADDRLRVLDFGGREQTHYPLTLLVDGGALTVQALFDTARFHPQGIRRALVHFESALLAFVRHPAARLREVELLEEAERQQLLVTWNETGPQVREDGVCVQELFEAQARRRPEAPALDWNGSSLTYRELNARADSLARHLRRLGVGPEVLVGLAVERSPEMLVGLLGVLKAGGGYLPLDPSHPAERLVSALKRSEARLLLAGRDLPEALAQAGPPVLRVDSWEADTGLAVESRAWQTADATCYVMFTSGSTGEPKGVQVSHRSVVRFLRAMAERPGLRESDSVLAVTTLSFDIAALELLLPLSVGARVVLADAETAADGVLLRRRLAESGANVMQATPATWWMLLEAGWTGSAAFTMLCGGEALPRELADRLLATGGRLWNLFGPTETTIWSTIAPITPVIPEGRTVPIGRPIAGTRVYALDPDLRPLPAGVAGELYIGGDGVARGYLGRPDLTAERFLPDSHAAEPGTRAYRVGDLVRWSFDGELEFLGRTDHQVKIRGFRIELGEVESALLRHPAVQRAVVTAASDPFGGRRLVAYAVPAGTDRPPFAQVRASLASTLPEFMIPSVLLWLDELPLTPSGKVDRRRLPVPEAPSPEAGPAAVPLTATEDVLAVIWSGILDCRRPGKDESFFDLGGHSLLATRLVSGVREAFGVELSLRRIFEAPTLQRMAAVIDAARRTGDLAAVPPIVPVPVSRRGDLPLSLSQQRLWFLAQLDPESAAYNIPFALRLSGRLDRSALEHAFTRLIRRQEALRTSFPTLDGQPVQRIAPPGPLALAAVDLSALPQDEREPELRRWIEVEAGAPFDLARGPLLRLRLLALAPEEHVLLITMHHIISDWWSVGVLSNELAELYAALAGGREPRLPELPVQYADFAVWQRELARDEVLAGQTAYWLRQLAGLPPALDLPFDRAPGSTSDSLAGRCSRRLSPAATERLKALGRRYRVTPFMTVLAGFQLLLQRLANEDNVTVGIPVAGRERPETEGLIGFFINTLALRTDLSGDPSFAELLRRVREATLGAYSNQDLPFERVVEELQPPRDPSRNPIFDVLLNFLNTPPPSALELPGLTLRAEGTVEVESKFLLTLEVEEEDGGLDFRFIYRQALFRPETVETMLRQLLHVLEWAVETPEHAIGTLSLVLPGMRGLLPDPSIPLAAAVYEPVAESLHAWAQRDPDLPALRFGSRTLSYRELDSAAERVARALTAGGLVAGDVVALLGQRCPGFMVAVVGILRAGGVLLPLDPTLPAERRKLLQQEAGARHLVRLGSGAVEGSWGDKRLSGLRLAVKAQTGELTGDVPLSETLPPVSPEAPAYLYFTSGTTGVPKAVLGRHKGLSHFVAWQRQRFGIGPGDVCAQMAGVGVDVLLRESFVAWTAGALLTVPDDPDVLAGGAAALAWAEREKVSILHSVPTLVQSWLDEAAKGLSLNSLRWLFLVGEPLNAALVDRWRKAFPAARSLVNLYGSTETNLAKCYFVVPDPPLPGVQPAGVPLPETQALVLAGGRLCGIGELGEVAIRTPFLSLGYPNAPEETRRRFVVNPFRDDAADLLYLTGDSGRYRLDGTLEVRGRRDDQIKIRGLRIEPAEVNAVLSQHPAVAMSVVIGRRRGESGEGALLAYVVRAEGVTVTSGELANHLARLLPPAMVPSSFFFLPALPLTESGKVDRKALPAPEELGRERSGALVPPRDALEHRLAQIWERVLNVQPVGVTDNFFDLGGHSLLGVRLLAELRSQLGRELPLVSLFQKGTVEHQASLLRQGGGAMRDLPLVPIRTEASAPPLFCVHPGGGGVMSYRPLAEELGPDFSLYGLQARGVERGEEPAHQLEEMASRYLKAVRAVQGKGPYRLAGWSFGGLVAFEMARQLAAGGEEVGLLALLDTRLGDWPAEAGLLKEALNVRGDRELAQLLAKAHAQGTLPPDYDLADLRRYLALIAAHREAKTNYQPQAYPGPVTFFRAEVQPKDLPEDSSAHWKELAGGGLQVITVPGDHYSMITAPHVEILARRLRERMGHAGHAAELASLQVSS